MNDFPTLDWSLVPPFLAALDTGSLSGAARALGRSQPTVGRQIAALEAQLGVTLFTRSARGLVPTAVAFDLARHAERMKEEAAALTMAAAGSSAAIGGTVRISASVIVATYLLPGIVAPLLRDAPGLEIEIHATDRTDNLLLREADIAVRMVAPRQDELIARKVGAFRLGLYAHRSYLEAFGHPDLVRRDRHVFVGLDRSTQIMDGMARAGIATTRGDFRLRTDDQAVGFEAIASGAGFGFAMRRLMDARPGMINVGAELPIPDLPVWIVAHRELRSAARVRRVFDHLVTEIGSLTDA